MARSDGTVIPRVRVAVSSTMGALRRTQTALNKFLWSTELSLNYVLDHFPKVFPDSDQLASEALAHLDSTAWFRNNQGRLKYSGSIGDTIEQVKANPPYLYRSVLTYFTSAFEEYLEERVAGLIQKPSGQGWGPYFQSLSHPKLTSTATPILLHDVISADLCRKIRNCVVHPPFELPTSPTDSYIVNFVTSTISKIKATPWWDGSTESIVRDTVNQFMGQVVEQKCRAPEMPIELFYALFNFTCLDTLAFQIEETLIDSGQILDGYAWRKESAVRRTDLIIEHGNAS